MDDRGQFDGASERPNIYSPLARWLQQVLAPPGLDKEALSTASNNEQHWLLRDGEDHLRFYQQLPDFVMALLNNDPLLNIRYASLLYHLAGCPTCHSAYLEMYSALRATLETAIEPADMSLPTRQLGPVPPRALVSLCQSLIRQAELLLRQSQLAGLDGRDSARPLLQQAMQISAHMTQMRGRALQGLVRVAALFERQDESAIHEPALYSYSLQLSTGGARHGGKTLRKAEAALQPPAAQHAIYIQANAMEGRITRQGETLELHLQDLDASLRGKYLTISIPLGLLLEPVRWAGGNPLAIRSSTPVDASGALRTPLGQTALRLDKTEERNLLEVLFLRLEVRPAE